MDYERHLAALRIEGTALADAARDALGADVPTCPGWTVTALLQHVGRGFGWVTRIVRDHADAEVSRDELSVPDEDVLEWYEGTLAELVDALATEDPDTPVWNWSGNDLRVAFWSRRMALEVAVHRWDAQRATGTERAFDTDLAVDGVDELLDVFLPDALAEQPVDGLQGSFQVTATDTGDVWSGTLLPDSSEVTRHAFPGTPAATVEGTASDLFLALWGRPVPVRVTGDATITGLLLA